ncbi:MAG: TIGR00289 family protein [DPANN group archaeon]|nr:TIGR00289 family protein [DPANN group archaeon]
MKVAVLFSGGKDSTYAMHRAMEQGREIVCLVSLRSKNPDSYMFHVPNIDMVKEQSKAIGIPILFRSTEGIKEKELKDLRNVLLEAKKKYNIEGVVSGAVASEYQRYRVETVCADLGLKSIAPLWHLDPKRYMTDFINDGFKALIVSVAADGFSKDWLGKPINLETLEELQKLHDKFGIHIGGEGGEIETFVTDGPIFKKKIEIEDAEKVWNHDAGVYVIKKFKLAKK